MKKARAKKKIHPQQIILCTRCKTEMLFDPDIQLHHCFRCGGWFVAGRIKHV